MKNARTCLVVLGIPMDTMGQPKIKTWKQSSKPNSCPGLRLSEFGRDNTSTACHSETCYRQSRLWWCWHAPNIINPREDQGMSMSIWDILRSKLFQLSKTHLTWFLVQVISGSWWRHKMSLRLSQLWAALPRLSSTSWPPRRFGSQPKKS